MKVRWIVAMAPLVAAALGAVGAPAAKTTRYRIESKTEQVVDLTVAGGAKQTVNVNQVVFLSVTLSDTASGKVMHAVLDSISTDAPLPDIASVVAKARGAWIHGLVDAWGRGTVVASSADSNEIVAQLKPTLSRFFPVVKPGSKQGDSWTDTSDVTLKSPSQALKTVRISTYVNAGTSSWDGGSALRFDATSTTSGAGTMENPMAGTMELEITSGGTESFFVGSDGTYLGGEAKSNGGSKIRAAMLPDAIPVTLTSHTTVAVIK